MVVFTIVLIALVLVVLATTGVAVRRRGRRPELEPPPGAGNSAIGAPGTGLGSPPPGTPGAATRGPRAPVGRRPRGSHRAGGPPPKVVEDPATTPAADLARLPGEVPEDLSGLAGTIAPNAVDDSGATVLEPDSDLDEGLDFDQIESVLARPRLRDRLGKARNLFAGYLGSVRLRDKIDSETWDELEEALILADVGVETTTELLDGLRGRVKRGALTNGSELLAALKDDVVARLAGDRELRLVEGRPNVWLFVGVNGVGKTTTIGKVGLAQRRLGHQVVMAAGDTFRAAAADQLGMWAERAGVDLVRGNEGGDPAAVVFDAVERSAARGVELVLADTAGRLHNKVNLMEELKKVRRVADRPPGQLSEVLLVIDATTGQNGLIQAKEFTAAVGVTGVVLTKLDGTAKGGIALAIQSELGIPIKLVGLGESAADLIEFDPYEFADALFAE